MTPYYSIRMATAEDAAALLDIYSFYVTHTAVSFEYSIPSVSEFAQRITITLKHYPYIVILEDEQIVGYAYASPYKARPAYSWSVETSIYLKKDCRGKGLGKQLYLALEAILKRQNIINLNACIAYTPVEDAYLSNASKLFHERIGYKKIAHFTKCGFKFDTWYDVIWMEKMLGDHPKHPAPFIPMIELNNKKIPLFC